MENKKETKKEKIMQVIDVFFVMLCGFACDDAFSKSCRCQGGRKSICDPGIYTGAGCSCAGSICNISCEKKQKRFKGNY